MNERQLALTVLEHVLKDKTYLNLELKRVLRRDMGQEQRRFLTALVNTTLENLYRIDYVIDKFVTAKRVHTVIRNILRLGVCQLMYFESVPVSAAVNESVKLAQLSRKGQLKGFVNATLRNIAENLGNVDYPDESKDAAEYLHVMYSYPRWLCEKYINDYGVEHTEAMMAYHAQAKTCVRLNKIKRMEPLAQYEPGLYLTDAYYIKNATSIENMPLFQKGEIAVQGEASMLCVRAAGIKTDADVLDVCAAPGGKSAYAAQLAGQGSVTALDLHEHRVKLIEQTARRLGVENIITRTADATKELPEYDEKFDVVLADMPCSALGLLYRKPDIKIHKQSGDIVGLVHTQREILKHCAAYVKPGGILLYSTCTINRQENEENIDWFLQQNSAFVEDDLKNELPEALMVRADGGRLQLFPHIDKVDGFFIARLKKR